ncbi:bifunctional ADP-dependent NAD(P)H-hydrate dehydratase/NAD(P)H-hydrate epimerase [Bartonella tamiae]|uniref:Bifunctional NAD(P)H-hydrate repair enzyme n=1 Tax=Bartonella tamiae Th239 TaxID=1094558 RepID=J0ZKS4_9HYPH|nr:bifunctional ADP-dependent NAD(P)H-hydrate dehydratase/NAD(P)H-hydrate epimerase [Bartonella tamiae]EJF88948.1 hypothetical protein ME5_01499 [Bartonella tamiae Th239]EJF94802.1 hypothetical protein MEG_00383 [Bartonella tamiae Th307]
MSAVIKKHAKIGLNNPLLPLELLTPNEMAHADMLAAQAHNHQTYWLMERAGAKVTDYILNTFDKAQKIAVLCGSGNNGGDGFVVARQLWNVLHEQKHDNVPSGLEVLQRRFELMCFTDVDRHRPDDAQKAFLNLPFEAKPLSEFNVEKFDLVVDALYGAGFNRELNGDIKNLIDKINQSKTPVLAIDLPSGVMGETGMILNGALMAHKTITFFRLKPGHVCYPGRAYCGDIILTDIGISDNVLDKIQPKLKLNMPALWQHFFPEMTHELHKYSRGHTVVFSGPSWATGAARLASYAAARIGSGAVTIIAPDEAVCALQNHLTSIMIYPENNNDDVMSFLSQRKVRSVILGPAFGDFNRAHDLIQFILLKHVVDHLVLDADAFTALAKKPQAFYNLIKESHVHVVMTPHEGEFQRLFPELASCHMTRIEKAKQAAKISGAVIVYKGADTIIASPCGRIAVTVNGSPHLATAGSGDVLSGLVGGLVAQNMPVFEAACAAVWFHAECGTYSGRGTIAEDLITVLPTVLKKFFCDENIT